jgi:regulator of protease activity HflC (stomatin/prohibitin superfamily)
MAEIRKFAWLRHMRSEPSVHVLRYRGGKLAASGRGLAFWFWPMSASVAEVPVDDRELHFLFHGRSRDFQDVTLQGVVTWRVADPERVGSRVDFSVDLERGTWNREPLDQLDAVLSGMVQALSLGHVAELSVRDLLAEGVEPIQTRVTAGLAGNAAIAEMGLAVVDVRVADLRPTPDLEKALQTPTRESIQQQADQATFERRAMAVEKERAIAEHELHNRIELARRESDLIDQRGANARKEVTEKSEAERIESDAQAARTRVASEAQAHQIRAVEEAKLEAERGRMEVYGKLPPGVMMGLAAREVAGKLRNIQHLNLSPDLLGPMLQNLMEAGTAKLTQPGGGR